MRWQNFLGVWQQAIYEGTVQDIFGVVWQQTIYGGGQKCLGSGLGKKFDDCKTILDGKKFKGWGGDNFWEGDNRIC